MFAKLATINSSARPLIPRPNTMAEELPFPPPSELSIAKRQQIENNIACRHGSPTPLTIELLKKVIRNVRNFFAIFIRTCDVRTNIAKKKVQRLRITFLNRSMVSGVGEPCRQAILFSIYWRCAMDDSLGGGNGNSSAMVFGRGQGSS